MTMKKLCVSFDGIEDTTGYLFSLAKCLSAALRCGGYEEYADDIIASSGFAFRMWAAADLCPSATSIWEFKKQKPWVENGGLRCEYVERMWGEDSLDAERRGQAIGLIKRSIDDGTAAVVWDLSGCEWGLAIGYDDDAQRLYTLKQNGCEDSIPYEKLGHLDIPILSVLCVTGKAPKPAEQLISDTKRLAVSHLRGEEWCDNAKGLAAYDTLINFIGEKLTADSAWNLEYYLGTYAALKRYAWKFFDKFGESRLAELYKNIFDAWQSAFELKRARDITDESVKSGLIRLLSAARTAEAAACDAMDRDK